MKAAFSRMALVRQALVRKPLPDIEEAVAQAIAACPALPRVRPGARVAVGVGSRGIRHIDRVVLQTIHCLKERGLIPFIVPAMGSHGGGTADGQKQVLAHLGITEEKTGVPILAGMETRQVDTLPGGMEIVIAAQALEADHIVVINRIKPHTKFRAEIASGLCKMLTIGLGKADGARNFHREAVARSFGIIEDAARRVLATCPVLFGLALIEDGFGETAHLEALAPEGMIEHEKELLKTATDMMGRIHLDGIDILVIDRIGKNISGIGMDSNVTGRHRDIVGDFYTSPHVKRIFARDLSPESGGNANGIGLADFTTRRLVDAIDVEKTYVNALAAISPEKAAIPMYFDNDRQAIEACARTIGSSAPSSARIVRIQSTAKLEIIAASEAFATEIEENPNLEKISPWDDMAFDPNGDLMPFPR